MDKVAYLEALQDGWANCQGCALHKERRQTVFGYGNPDAQIMIVGEAPGENEDRQGLPFVGQAGFLLDQLLANVSAREDVIMAAKQITTVRGGSADAEAERNRFRARLRDLLLQDFYITNVVMCRPPENRDPAPKEVEACSTRIKAQIYAVDPVLIISAGRVATTAVVGKKISILHSRGDIFDVEFQGQGITFRYPVMALLHPSYLLRLNDFNVKGGESAKTYNSLLKAMILIDNYNLRHYGIPLPKRPDPEMA